LEKTGLRKWFRSVDFVIVSRDIADPDPPLPPGRKSPMGDPADFYLDCAGEREYRILKECFPKSKHAHFRKVIDNPNADFVIRCDEDPMIVWCFMMHSQKRIRDPEYGFAIPINEGRDLYQFDGWVNPDYRGLMVGILGTNCANQLRRSEGFERLYATLREKDLRSLRLHKRLGYRTVGRVRHWRFGPFRHNRIEFDPGEHPQEGREPREQLAELHKPITPCVLTGPPREGYRA